MHKHSRIIGGVLAATLLTQVAACGTLFFPDRRGQIEGTEMRTGAVQINAFIPLSNMFGYATTLRSKTQGRGQYVMEPSHYAEVPKSIAETVIKDK